MASLLDGKWYTRGAQFEDTGAWTGVLKPVLCLNKTIMVPMHAAVLFMLCYL